MTASDGNTQTPPLPVSYPPPCRAHAHTHHFIWRRHRFATFTAAARLRTLTRLLPHAALQQRMALLRARFFLPLPCARCAPFADVCIYSSPVTHCAFSAPHHDAHHAPTARTHTHTACRCLNTHAHHLPRTHAPTACVPGRFHSRWWDRFGRWARRWRAWFKPFSRIAWR